MKILEVLGPQDEDDLSFIEQEAAFTYHEQLQSKCQTRENKLKLLYSDTPSPIVDLLSDMMHYNPYFRPSAKECLAFPIFDALRNPDLELEYPVPIGIKVDSHRDYKSNLNCTIIE